MDKINKKILIVEDDQFFRSILEIKFTSEGFLVATAENGEEGLAAVQKEQPDLVLSDVLMPKMGGIEMVKKIRESNQNVLIIFLTNVTDADYTNNIKDSKEFDYLIKSDLRIDDIVQKVKIKLGIN